VVRSRIRSAFTAERQNVSQNETSKMTDPQTMGDLPDTDPGLVKVRNELQTKDGTDQVRVAAEFALRRKGADSAERALSADKIADIVYDELHLPLGPARASFGPYLSNVSRLTNSPIVSKGRGRGGGYFLSSLAAKQAAEQATDVVESSKEESEPASDRESALYPVLVDWLVGNGYRARDTAAMRRLGRWSNPDVTGVKVSEHLGRMEIEIATIEAKRTLVDWERFFFEAVAHRRFSNRAYFAFPTPESSLGKLPAEMRYYSELYDVGVLTVVMADEVFRRYSDGGGATSVDMMEADVVEVLSARRSGVPMEQQRRFCEAVQITDLATLMTWGK
jgi:hypothetical protein